MTDSTTVRSDWEERIHERSDAGDGLLELPAPAWLRAAPGVGHVRLSWSPVVGAAGYVIEQRAGDAGEAVILRHGGSDVAAVPGTSFAVTGVDDGVDYRFRVAAVSSPRNVPRSWSAPATGATLPGAADEVDVHVDASRVTGRLDRVWRMVGAERLSQLRLGIDEHGNDVGAEFLEALRVAHDDLGASSVRAHAILHDDLGVARRDDGGELCFDFSGIDDIYDRLAGTGLRPVVELSFMPAALASNPAATVFTYRGIVSPPVEWAEWGALVRALASHLVDRYGLDEVAEWGFEVWNEPNLGVFWTATRDDYFRLYDEAARAIKSVSPRLSVGGPSSAACEWVEELAAHAVQAKVPLDFVSTHTYGNIPLDLRPSLARHGVEGTPIWWTEWGVGSTHFGSMNDSVMGAPFVLSGYAAAQGRLDALAYWVISDHFEELGRPPRLFHDGFGLLSVGNLRKPRYWAAHLAAHQGDDLLATEVRGDGAGVLVEASATRHDDGTVDVLVWNGTINADMRGGDPRLDRTVQMSLSGLAASRYEVRLARVDQSHSNINSWLAPGVDWPDGTQWDALRSHDVLDEERLADVDRSQDQSEEVVSFELRLPMPGVARARLRPC